MSTDTRIRINKTHSALKHGGYAATIILPGEDPAEFAQLHRKLIAELTPNGAMEEDIVATMAGLVWRKQNLATFRIAELARHRCEQIKAEKLAAIPRLVKDFNDIDPAQRKEAIRVAEDQARNELGDTYELVEVGETATFGRLMTELQLEERFDTGIDKCLKRLLFLRGVKSISPVSSSASPPRIPGPTIDA